MTRSNNNSKNAEPKRIIHQAIYILNDLGEAYAEF